MNTTPIGTPVVGWQPAPPSAPGSPLPPVPSNYDALSAQAVLADFGRRLQNLEKAVKLSVPGDRITSMIALTSDTTLIQSDRIGLLGEVTFADWQRDLSGQATGSIDPSITQIRGGVIRTGRVASLDGQSWLDLDAHGTTPFLKCHDTVSISPDGTFSLGGPAGKRLVWDGANLTIQASAMIGGTPASTVVNNAANALAGLGDTLSKSAGGILSGQISFQSAGGFKAGNLNIASNGTVSGVNGNPASGVAITQNGIVGYAGGNPTFTLDAATGAATFSGVLSAATGTFSGTLSVGSNGIVANNTNPVFSAIFTANTGAGIDFQIANVFDNCIVTTTGKPLMLCGKDVKLLPNGGQVYLGANTVAQGNISAAGYTISAGAFSGSLSISDIAVGGIANFSFSTNGGSTWTPIKLRRDA